VTVVTFFGPVFGLADNGEDGGKAVSVAAGITATNPETQTTPT